jgi:CDGSH-type Zn-finger protein
MIGRPNPLRILGERPNKAIAAPASFHLPAALVAARTNGMSDPVIFQKSPIVQKTEPGTFWWCSCGRSASQPFCDGSHQGSEFSPLKVELNTGKTVAWCACKHSKNKPFCDGSHCQL